MAISSKSNAMNCHIRSISLPCSRSHPTILDIEEKLTKLKTLETMATSNTPEKISSCLCELMELYKSIDELLNLPLTLQTLSKHQNEKWVDRIFENSVKLLDICGNTREITSQVKEHVRDLQSSLRRGRKGESSIIKYTSFRKKMKKDVKRLISSLKKMDLTLYATVINVVDQHVSTVIRILSEVNAISITIFQYVLVYLLSSKTNRSYNKWSISRLVHNGRVACEEQLEDNKNDLESIDNELLKVCNGSSSEVQKKLMNLEVCFEGIETTMENMFRCLIKSRTSLLNIVAY